MKKWNILWVFQILRTRDCPLETENGNKAIPTGHTIPSIEWIHLVLKEGEEKRPEDMIKDQNKLKLL